MQHYSILPTADRLLKHQIEHYSQRLSEARKAGAPVPLRAFLRKTLHELKTKRQQILN